jgi:glucosamine-6-phosphate deaminase
MRTLVLSGVEAAVASAAELVLEAVATSAAPVVALPTGRTMVPLYDEISLRFAAGDRGLAGVRGFNLDELLVAENHPASFAGYMRRHAHGRTGLDAARCDIPRAAADPAAECARYDAAISAAGGFDLAILGVGADGHVAYNLPGAPVAGTHVVELPPSLADRLGVAPEDRPLRAITMGLAPLLQARRVIVLATGGDKSAAVRSLVDGPVDEQWPCSLFCDHPAIDVVLTLEAASEAVH